MSILFGMLRQHKFNFIDVYREEAFTALKAIVKQVCLQKTILIAFLSVSLLTWEPPLGLCSLALFATLKAFFVFCFFLLGAVSLCSSQIIFEAG